MLQSGLKMTEDIIKERNNEVQAQLLQKFLNHDSLMQTDMKLFTGVNRKKRKEKLPLEIHEIEENRKKLTEIT